MKQHATKLTATGFALALAGVLPATGIAQAAPEPTDPANPTGGEQQNQQTNPKVKTANELEAAKKAAQESAAKAADADSKAQDAAQAADKAAKESGEKSAASEKAKKDALDALAKAQADSKKAASDAKNLLEKANEKKTAADAAAKAAGEALAQAEQAKADADKAVADHPAPDAEQLQAAKDKVAKAEKDKQAAEAKRAEAQNALAGAQEQVATAEKQLQTATEAQTKAASAKQTAGADVSAKQQKVEELEKKVKDLSGGESSALQEQIKAAQEALDKAKAEVETAKAQERQRQTELDEARNAVTAAESKLQAKRDAAEQAKKDKATADQAVEAAAAQVTAAQGEQAEAENALATRKGETAAAKKAADDAKTAQTQAEANLQKAREDKRNADEAVKAAETEVANAQKAVDEAAKKFNQGSFGFFEAMGATDALAALNNSREKQYTVKGDLKDATSLENMKETFRWIRKANELRAKGGLNGRHLEPLKVSDTLMAMAQIDANRAAYMGGHSREFNVGENLAWGPADRDPFKGWYTEEKENYETNNGGQIGHYLALMDRANINGEYQDVYFTATGFALSKYAKRCTQIVFQGKLQDYCYPLAFSQVFAQSEDTIALPVWVLKNETLYDVDEYEKRFMDYYNSVTPEGAKQKLAEAKAKLADLQAKAKAAGEKVTSDEKAVTDAQAEVNAKDAAWKDAQSKEADAAAAVETAIQKVKDAENQKTAAEGVAKEKEQAVQTAAEAATAAESALENAKTKVATAQKALEAAQQQVKEKEAVQAEKQKALDELTVDGALAAAQKELAQAQQELAAAKEKAQAAATELEAATQAQQQAQVAKEAAVKDLEEATTANQQAAEAVSQAENERAAAQAELNPLAEQQMVHDQLVAKAEKADQDLQQAQAAADKANKDLEVVTKVATDLQNEQQAKQALADKLAAIDGQNALENGLDATDSDLNNLGLPALFNAYPSTVAAAQDAQQKAERLAGLAKTAREVQKEAAEANRQAQAKLAAAQAEYGLYHQVQAATSINQASSFAPGDTLQVHFTGFSPGSMNQVVMHSTVVDLGVHLAVGKGEFIVPVKIPSELGTHTVTATNEWGESASFKFEVREKSNGKKVVRTVVIKGNVGKPAAGEQMPVTGVSMTPLVALNSLAVITGVGLVAASRRRRTQEI